MTQVTLITPDSVRDYMELNASTSSRYSDATIGSNIRAASWTLERATGRVFGDVTATKLFTTNGQSYLTIPGLRTATAISLQGSALTVDSTYYLIPDVQQSGVSTGIQFRAFGTGGDYRSNPEWFDRNLDSPWYPGNRGNGRTSIPNDLSIAGAWGYTDIPEPILHATKVLAAFYTKRPDALLSGAITTPDGNFVDLSQLPVEVMAFVESWKVGSMVQAA